MLISVLVVNVCAAASIEAVAGVSHLVFDQEHQLF